jgi:1-phosphatidylinositol-4-phosphate 5-kinase
METNCSTFLFKALRGQELANLIEFLPFYLEYLMNHPNSLLPRYYGVFSFQLRPSHRPDYEVGLLDPLAEHQFLLMGNWFSSPLKPQLIFDFKGSSLGRTSISFLDELEQGPSGLVLKDLDYHLMVENGQIQKFRIAPDMKKMLLNQITLDADLLKSHGFIDYRYIGFK